MNQPNRRRAVLALASGLALGAPWLAGEEKPREGRTLYNTKCAQCHGRTGVAPPEYAKKGVPDLKDADWQTMRSDAEIRKVIAEGSEGTEMKPFNDQLSPAEIDALTQYIRKLGPPK